MFKFSLQTALEVREREEKIQMKELALKMAAEREVQQWIDGMESRVAESDRILNESKQAGHFTIEQMKQQEFFKKKMKVDLRLQYQKLEEAKREVTKQQSILLQASKARKTMEILRDREKSRYQKELDRRQRAFMDEVAVNMFFQKRTQ